MKIFAKKKSYYDDYDYDNYTSRSTSFGWPKSKSKKNKAKTSWYKNSWSNYSYLQINEDDDSSLFVKSPENYVTPSSKDIKNKTHVYKQSSIDTIKELSRVCYFKMIDEKDYISKEYSDYENLNDSFKAIYDEKKSLYDSIFDQFIPGFTPLEQAIAIFLKMKHENYNEYSDSFKKDVKEINFDKHLNFDRIIYSDPILNEQLEYNSLSKERKMDILNIISLIGDLGTQFKVEKEVDEKIVANSQDSVTKIMRDYSQFHMINLYQKMYPNFRSKFLTKDLTVNVPVDRKEKKQMIIIILDYSGSMHEDEKQIWVNAILIDRFKYVIQGEAEVFFSYFVNDPDALKFSHITNKEEVISFWQSFSNYPTGGITEVGDMVVRISNEIEQKRLMNLDIDLSEQRPEILVINDGEDDININEFPYKVNAITLMNYNDQLKDLCTDTGGKLIDVTYNNEITAYSSEGVETIK
jgi:hypothetical protein